MKLRSGEIKPTSSQFIEMPLSVPHTQSSGAGDLVKEA